MSEQTPTPEPNKGGRRTKLTDAVFRGIVEYIRKGNFPEVARRRFGISQKTYYRWMQTGRKFPLGRYGQFRQAVIEAVNDSESNAVEKILAAGDDDPKNLQWYLERRFPERWGKEIVKLNAVEKEISELEALVNEPGSPQITEAG